MSVGFLRPGEKFGGASMTEVKHQSPEPQHEHGRAMQHGE
jgi:hypothetical protein